MWAMQEDSESIRAWLVPVKSKAGYRDCGRLRNEKEKGFSAICLRLVSKSPRMMLRFRILKTGLMLAKSRKTSNVQKRVRGSGPYVSGRAYPVLKLSG